MKQSICIFLLAICVCSCVSLPLASYTVTGHNQQNNAIKNVLDTVNSRYSTTITTNINLGTVQVRTVVLSGITYQQTLAGSYYCGCKSDSRGYSDLVAYWNNLLLQTDTGGVSKYVGNVTEYFPSCPGAPTYTVTEYLHDVGSYPLNVTYPKGVYNPYLSFAEETYSSTVDTSAFNLQCCNNATPLC